MSELEIGFCEDCHARGAPCRIKTLATDLGQIEAPPEGGSGRISTPPRRKSWAAGVCAVASILLVLFVLGTGASLAQVPTGGTPDHVEKELYRIRDGILALLTTIVLAAGGLWIRQVDHRMKGLAEKFDGLREVLELHLRTQAAKCAECMARLAYLEKDLEETRIRSCRALDRARNAHARLDRLDAPAIHPENDHEAPEP